MHLIASQQVPTEIGDAPVDLGQTPGAIVLLSAADTELACLAAASARLTDTLPSLRLASLLRLRHPRSVDLYVESVISSARLVIVRVLGGIGYWRYGVEQLVANCHRSGTGLALLAGDAQRDAELERLSNLPVDVLATLHAHLAEGGLVNAEAVLRLAAALVAAGEPDAPPLARPLPTPTPLPRTGFWHPARSSFEPAELVEDGRPLALIVFYRALLLAGDLAPIEALMAALAARGLAAAGLFVQSLKEPAAAARLATLAASRPPAVVLNLTGFAVGSAGGTMGDPLRFGDWPVLQLVLSSEAQDIWQAGGHGLSPRDLAMQVALPELDGRVLARAVSFKQSAAVDPQTELAVQRHEPRPDRIAFTADLAAAWVRLGTTPLAARRIAIVLPNYPARDGRLANGVGLDTPASTVRILHALRDAGYGVRDAPADGAELMRALAAGVTNAASPPGQRLIRARLPLAQYRELSAALPVALRAAVDRRWGPAEQDPRLADNAFPLAVLPLGHVLVALQPARGYAQDAAQSHHDPHLPPPHAYLAFHLWLRQVWAAQAIVHVGKHGNLEWLPGKALALGPECWPEAALGPLPQLYPFIVNDPGEGSQAKRRISAVIVDHLTPPLTRAGGHGDQAVLERLLDELSEAMTLDPRRAAALRVELDRSVASSGLAADLALKDLPDDAGRLMALDRHLCELKELQIRDGLHVFGCAPAGLPRQALLVALVRAPRGLGRNADASILTALAQDLDLAGFDPLAADPAVPWTGPRPAVLGPLSPTAWRTAGDMIERLEALALALASGEAKAGTEWIATRAVLDEVHGRIGPLLDRSAEAEIAGLLAGLDGRAVAPGPSGAPTRGRLDVLPTGRNFFSVDPRAVPTPTAFRLGWESADLVLEHYRQTEGAWPRRLALSAWGTANMRTGGEDIAQALAFLGCRPTWDAAGGRVTGVEILPLAVLGRPRVDVTLRVSGFFRDAFPAQLELLDDAVRAVAGLDEPAGDNPLAAATRQQTGDLEGQGVNPAQAQRLATMRIFGAAPGSYGTALQALVDEGAWADEAELARSFLAWGGHAYGRSLAGEGAAEPLAARLAALDLVLHNQDNREHDILDSDDYWQFAGGLALAARHLTGRNPLVLHMDSSRAERLRVRRLEEEIGLIVRGRASNPRWLEGVMRHGYKGAFEIAATVDYLFAFAVTSRRVGNHHFQALYDAYLADDRVRAFIREHNPAALGEMVARFAEAIDRGLWRPPRNSLRGELDAVE